MLRFGGYPLQFQLVPDRSRNNKHSRNFFWCSGFYGKDCNWFSCEHLSYFSEELSSAGPAIHVDNL